MLGRLGKKASIGIIESDGGFLFGDPMNPGDFSFPIEKSGLVSDLPSSHLHGEKVLKGCCMEQVNRIRKRKR